MTANKLLEEITSNVIEGRADKNSPLPEEKRGMPGVKELTEKALEEGIDVEDLLNKTLIMAMRTVGSQFESGEIFIPEMLIAAQALKAGMEVLKPVIIKKELKPIGKVAIGTVKGDVHDVGKSLVKMMLEGEGFEVIDLGIDVPNEIFIKTVKAEKVQLLGMSSLLTITMMEMKNVIESLKEVGIRSRLKIMIGGAPVTEEFAEQIGADGYAIDAIRAVRKARELLALN